MKYKFLGKPDKKFPDLITGKIYDLTVITRTGFGSMFSYKYPKIVSPIKCPYSSWESFYDNWEPVKTLK